MLKIRDVIRKVIKNRKKDNEKKNYQKKINIPDILELSRILSIIGTRE